MSGETVLKQQHQSLALHAHVVAVETHEFGVPERGKHETR